MDPSTWWFPFARESYKYALAHYESKRDVRDRIGIALLEKGAQWATLTGVPAAGPLMRAHAGFYMRLADSAWTRHKRGMDLAVDRLVANADEQGTLYVGAFARFSREEFVRLFKLYISAAGGIVLAFSKGDMDDLRRQTNAQKEGAAELAWFWNDVLEANFIGRQPAP